MENFEVFLDDTHKAVGMSRHNTGKQADIARIPSQGLRCAVYIGRYRGTSIGIQASRLAVPYHWITPR
jgi:hypothetical protein